MGRADVHGGSFVQRSVVVSGMYEQCIVFPFHDAHDSLIARRFMLRPYPRFDFARSARARRSSAREASVFACLGASPSSFRRVRWTRSCSAASSFEHNVRHWQIRIGSSVAVSAARTRRSSANGGYAKTSAESSLSFLSLRTAPVRCSCLTRRALGDAAISQRSQRTKSTSLPLTCSWMQTLIG